MYINGAGRLEFCWRSRLFNTLWVARFTTNLQLPRTLPADLLPPWRVRSDVPVSETSLSSFAAQEGSVPLMPIANVGLVSSDMIVGKGQGSPRQAGGMRISKKRPREESGTNQSAPSPLASRAGELGK